MQYSPNDACSVTGIKLGNLNSLIDRQQVVLECGQEGRPGRGRLLRLSRSDVFQVAAIKALAAAGVARKRCPLFWRILGAQSRPSQLVLYVMERPDQTDCNFALAYTPERPADVPADAARIDVGAIHRDVNRKLDGIDAERIAAVPSAFPHRIPFIRDDNPGAAWSIYLQAEAGEPDAEAVARLADAVEARSHVLLCGRTMAALASLVQVMERMSGAVQVH